MTNRSVRTTGALMITGAVLANVAFVLLGSVFSYPDILREPATHVLRTFHGDATAIALLFTCLAMASAVLVPTAVLSRHLVPSGRARRVMVLAGVAAGVVQVVGLMRWPVLVTHLADVVADPASSALARADAVDTFRTLHLVLGRIIGEAFGYVLTAIWTVALVRGVSHRPGRWFAPLGYVSAALILTGLLENVGVEAAGLTNFVGYIAWSVWMVAFGTALVRHSGAFAAEPIDDRAPATAGPALRPWWPWVLTAFAFPPVGYVAHIIAGPVDSTMAAAVGGLVAGAGLGAAQWALLRRRGVDRSWIVATAGGLAAGLAAGAALVSYRTDRPSLAVMGAVSGLAVGVAQAAVVGRRRMLLWPVVVAALWTVGWTVTASAGVSVGDQFVVFGATGAVAAALLQSAVIGRFVPAAGGPGRGALPSTVG